MEYRKLGNTDMFVSVISLGGWALASDRNWGEQDKATSIATVHAALDAGVNFFNTAEGYGKEGASERVLGEALAGHRHEVVIATKIEVDHNYLSADETIQACERSLQRLNTDYVDVYQIHWPSRVTPITETVEAMEKLRQQGKVRTIGVANFGVQDLSDLLEVGRADSNELPYSLVFRAIEYDIADKCVANSIGILPYSPLAQGLLAGKFSSADEVPVARARTRIFSGERSLARHGEAGCEEEAFAAIDEIRGICGKIRQPMARVALAWLLHQPGVTSVIAGARNPEQLQQNVQAAALALRPEIVAELAQVTDEVKQKLGPNPDPWQSDARPR